MICWAIFLQAHSHETASASGPRSFLLAYALFFLYDKATLFLPQNNPLWTIVLSFLCGLALFLKLKHSLHEDNQLVFEPLWLMSGMLVYRVSSFLVNGIALTYGFSSGLFDNQVNVWFWVLPPAFLLGLACHQRIQLRKRRCKTHPTEQRPHLSGDAATSLSPRENEVIARDLLGEKTHSTSDAMGIAPGTISTLRSRARKKLNISARTDLERLVRDGKIHLDNPADPPANNHLSWKCLAISLLAALIVIASTLSDTITLPNGDQIFQASYYFIWGAGVLLQVFSLAFMSSPTKCFPSRAPTKTPTEIAISLYSLSAFVVIGAQLYLDLLTTCSLFICTALLFGLLHMCGTNKERATSLVAVPYYSGIGLILSPIVGTYYELWGLPLILNFIVCGMALLTFFRQYGALRLDRQTEKAQEADGMLLLSEYGITGLQANIVLDLAKGMSVKEICETRSTTTNTVKSYRRRTFKKLGVHSVEELRELINIPTH